MGPACLRTLLFVFCALTLHLTLVQAGDDEELRALNASLLPNAIKSAESGAVTSSIVGGHVNVITGAFVDSHADVSVAGPTPLVFQRLYSSSNRTGNVFSDGWCHNQAELAYMTTQGVHYHLALSLAA